MKWIKTGHTVYGDGGSDTVYGVQDRPDIEVVSRKRPIPHANGEGAWMCTTYFVVADGEDVRECWKLTEAKAYAESLMAKK